ASSFKVVDTQEVDDVAIHIVEDEDLGLKEGTPVHGIIDWDVRYERMKQHTASHLIFSSARRALGLEELMYMGVQIREDTSRIDISHGKTISSIQIREIERLSNRVCFENKKVNSFYMTRAEAEESYGKRLGLTEITPSGRVRVVEVEDWDVALCSGTHVRSTAEIGLINVLDRFRLKKGVERIEFTAGKEAYKRHDEAILTLTNVAQILKTSTTEVPARVKHLQEERDRLKEDLGRAMEKLVEFQTLQLTKEAEPLGEFIIVKNKLQNVDAQSLKRIASTLVERDPHLIAILGSDFGNNAVLIGAAGDMAVEKGVNMADIISEAAQVIRGGGGGNARIAQAGGKDPDSLEKALQFSLKKVLGRLEGQE
ncbi:MAG: DHHA1 domain-containing protein, partial [Candidatus Bathyarchaeia archaeon]